MRLGRPVPAALLLAALAAVPAPVRAIECFDDFLYVDLVGVSPAGDAYALRTVLDGKGNGDSEKLCPYPSVKGRCTAGVTLSVCRASGGCKEFVIYESMSLDPESGAISSSEHKTTQAEAARNLAAAKQAMAEAKIVQAEGIWLGSGAVTIGAADLKAFGDPGAVELVFGFGMERREAKGLPEMTSHPGELVARLADGTAIPLEISGFRGDAGWVHGDVDISLSKDRALLALAFHGDCDGTDGGRLRPFVVPLRTVSARLFNARGYRRWRAGDAAGAANDFARAVEVDPDLVMARCNLGLALVKTGRGEEGMAAIAEALRRGDASGKAPTACR